MFVRTSRHRSGSSWTSPTCAHGGGRASTRVARVDVENALFIFGRADTAAVGRSSETAQRQSYLVVPPSPIALTRVHALEFTTDVLRRRIHREPPRARRRPRRCGFRPPPHPRHGRSPRREHIKAHPVTWSRLAHRCTAVSTTSIHADPAALPASSTIPLNAGIPLPVASHRARVHREDGLRPHRRRLPRRRGHRGHRHIPRVRHPDGAARRGSHQAHLRRGVRDHDQRRRARHHPVRPTVPRHQGGRRRPAGDRLPSW